MTIDKKKIGYAGELTVAEKLKADGFKILAQNYQTKRGEIDIIATKDDTICFVEVKTRTNSNISMLEIIRPIKQKRISLAALDFLRKNPNYLQIVCRFDVALYEQKIDKLTYIPNAFYAKI